MYEGSLFFKSCPTVVMCRLLDDSCYSDRCEVIPFCGSGVHLSVSDAEHLFTRLLAICITSLEKKSIQFFCPFFDCFLILSYMSSLGILDIVGHICKYFPIL